MTAWADWQIPGFCGFGLHLKLDGFRLVYTLLAVLMWAASGVFSREYMAHYEKKMRYYVFFWVTFPATVGVFLSADLYTTFIFFEIMSFTSFVWVIFDEKKESVRAAQTYLAVAVAGGMVMLMGLFLLYDLFGTLEMDRLEEGARIAVEQGRQARLYAAGLLLLFGFGAKAGCFPLHIWLPKAHPVAPAPASALLSGILTKTGVFGIILVSCRMFGTDRQWGVFIAVLGLVTMFLGALLAMFSVNLKRTLACSSVSQIGFILSGVGMYVLLGAAGENPSLAARGAFLHMVNHSLFKLVLFLCAGAVFMNLHQLDLNEIRGFGRKKPVLAFCFGTGALGICGVPLWSGYISKTLLHESIVEYRKLFPGWAAAEWVFLFTGGMTVSYMLKLYIAIFVEKHPKKQEEWDKNFGAGMGRASQAALLVPTLLIFLLGLFPSLLTDRLADLGQGFFGGGKMEHPVRYFAFSNLKGGLISISIGVLLYFLVIRKGMTAAESGSGPRRYVDRWPALLDLENLLYRPVLLAFLPGVGGAVFGFLDRYLVPVLTGVSLAVSSVLCRAMDHLADGLVILARHTTHSRLKEKNNQKEKDRIARFIGKVIDRLDLSEALKRRVKEKASGTDSVRVQWLMRKEEAIVRIGRLVEESFSFGLLLFSVGLCLTLGYLLYEFIRF